MGQIGSINRSPAVILFVRSFFHWSGRAYSGAMSVLPIYLAFAIVAPLLVWGVGRVFL